MDLRRAAALTVFILIPFLLVAGGKKEEAPDTTPAPPREGTPIITDSSLAARVNGEGIEMEQYTMLLQSNIDGYVAQGQELTEDQKLMLGRQLLDGLVTRAVLMQEAARRSIEIAPAEYEAALQQFKAQFPNDSQYQIALESQGFSVEQFEQELTVQLTIEKLVTQEVLSSITVSSEEARAFYDENPEMFTQAEQVSARHIIISTQELTTDAEKADAKARAEAVRQQLLAGADFAELAKEVSEGPSAPDGGELGTFGRGQMVPAFEEAAFALSVDEISAVIETQFGFHVLQVTEKIPARTVSYEEMQERIIGYLSEQQQGEAVQEYIGTLKAGAAVELYVEF